LFFLKKAREFMFATAREWQDFADTVGQACVPNRKLKLHEIGELAQSNDCRVVMGQSGIEVLGRVSIAKSIEFTAPNFRRLLSVDSRNGGELSGHVDFERIAVRSGIKPTRVDGLLSKCRGLVERTERKDDSFVVHLAADKWVKVPLTQSEFQEFQTFLRGLD
jgi:hypothetical protein